MTTTVSASTALFTPAISAPLAGAYPIQETYQYTRDFGIVVNFETDEDALRAALPQVLEIDGDVPTAFVKITKHISSAFGPYTGVYLGAKATFEGKPANHIITGVKSSQPGALGGREMWGMPYQVGPVESGWTDEVLSVVASRGAHNPLLELQLQLTGRSEGIKYYGTLRTHVARKIDFTNWNAGYSLIAVDSSATTEGVETWDALATLKLGAGTPLEDWSCLPVRRVLNAKYETGGQITLPQGYSIADWV